MHYYLLLYFNSSVKSRVVPLAKQPNLIASSSGDGSIKVWDLAQFKELSSKICQEDVADSLLPVEDKSEGNGEKKSTDSGKENEDLRVKKSKDSHVAVKSMRIGVVRGKNILAVNVDRFPGVVLYEVEPSATSVALKFVQKLCLQGEVWDFGFDKSGRLFVVEKGEGSGRIRVFQCNDNQTQFVEDSELGVKLNLESTSQLLKGRQF